MMKLHEYSLNQLKTLLPDTLVQVPAPLAESIARHGVVVPPVVCNGIVCDGHRRLLASRQNGTQKILCLETSGNAGLLFAELNSQRELSACEAAAVFASLHAPEQSAFLKQVGLSESPQMRFVLGYIAKKILPVAELASFSLPVNIWRELAHLGEAISLFAAPLLTLPGTAAEKRNIAAMLRQAHRKNQLPESLLGATAAEVLANLQKISQPRRTGALEKFEAAVSHANLPPGATVRIDPTFSMPGLQLNMQITRNNQERVEQAQKAIAAIFAEVAEL